ncbi:YcdB/YcdC domain-containing protein, partial [Acinetobacter baumannii]|uniref:YcdB/YcdC domain-containing protein n=2 Tax=Bacteria TaxID=2 RepID=UPI002FE179D8
MRMDISVLRTAARAITFIPEHYELVMEDNTPKGFDEKERTFIWEDPTHEDRRIEVSLSLGSGQLMRLQIDRERDHVIEGVYPIEQATEAAKRFMIQHHPDYE